MATFSTSAVSFSKFESLSSGTLGGYRTVIDEWRSGNAKFLLSFAKRKKIVVALMLEPSVVNASAIQLLLSNSTKYEFFSTIRNYIHNDPKNQVNVNALRVFMDTQLGAGTFDTLYNNQKSKPDVSLIDTIDNDLVIATVKEVAKNAEKHLSDPDYTSTLDCVRTYFEIVIDEVLTDDPAFYHTLEIEKDVLVHTEHTIQSGPRKGQVITEYDIKKVHDKILEPYGMSSPQSTFDNTPANYNTPNNGYNKLITATHGVEGWHLFGVGLQKGFHSIAVWIRNMNSGPSLFYFSDQHALSYKAFQRWFSQISLAKSTQGFVFCEKFDFLNFKYADSTETEAFYWKIKAAPPAAATQKSEELQSFADYEMIAAEADRSFATPVDAAALDLIITDLNNTMHNVTIISKQKNYSSWIVIAKLNTLDVKKLFIFKSA